MTKRYPVCLLGRPLNLVILQVSFSHAINISCTGSVLTAFAATFNPLHSAARTLSNTESRKISAVSGDDQCQRRVKLLVFCRLKLGDHNAGTLTRSTWCPDAQAVIILPPNLSPCRRDALYKSKNSLEAGWK